MRQGCRKNCGNREEKSENGLTSIKVGGTALTETVNFTNLPALFEINVCCSHSVSLEAQSVT